MNDRENRVINAFINCVNKGEYSLDYAITLIEDNQRYGWLSNDAKNVFNETFGLLENIIEESENTETNDVISETEVIS